MVSKEMVSNENFNCTSSFRACLFSFCNSAVWLHGAKRNYLVASAFMAPLPGSILIDLHESPSGSGVIYGPTSRNAQGCAGL